MEHFILYQSKFCSWCIFGDSPAEAPLPPPQMVNQSSGPRNRNDHLSHHTEARSQSESLSHSWDIKIQYQTDQLEYRCPGQHLQSQLSWTASSGQSSGHLTPQTWDCSRSQRFHPAKWAQASPHCLSNTERKIHSKYNRYLNLTY